MVFTIRHLPCGIHYLPFTIYHVVFILLLEHRCVLHYYNYKMQKAQLTLTRGGFSKLPIR